MSETLDWIRSRACFNPVTHLLKVWEITCLQIHDGIHFSRNKTSTWQFLRHHHNPDTRWENRFCSRYEDTHRENSLCESLTYKQGVIMSVCPAHALSSAPELYQGKNVRMPGACAVRAGEVVLSGSYAGMPAPALGDTASAYRLHGVTNYETWLDDPNTGEREKTEHNASMKYGASTS